MGEVTLNNENMELRSGLFDKITDIIIEEEGCLSERTIEKLVSMLREKAERQKCPQIRKETFTSNVIRSTTDLAMKCKVGNTFKENIKLEELTDKMSECLLREKGNINEQDIYKIEHHLKSVSKITNDKLAHATSHFAKPKICKTLESSNELKSNSATNISTYKAINRTLSNVSCQTVSCTSIQKRNNLLRNNSALLINKDTNTINRITDAAKTRTITSSCSQARARPTTPKQYPVKHSKMGCNNKFKKNVQNNQSLNKSAPNKSRAHQEGRNETRNVIPEQGSREIQNDRKKWKTDTERITVMMTDNFLKSLISIEKKTENNNGSNDLLLLYDKIIDIILHELKDVNNSDVQKISDFLENYVGRRRGTDKVLTSITPDMPTWAIRGFLENDGSNNTLKIVGQLLEKLAEFIIHENGKLNKTDITDFCTELTKKLHDYHRIENDRRLQLSIQALRQAKMRYKHAKLIPGKSVALECTQKSKDNLKSRKESLHQSKQQSVIKSSNPQCMFIHKNEPKAQNHNFYIDSALKDSLRSLAFIKTFSEQLLTEDWNKNVTTSTVKTKCDQSYSDSKAITPELNLRQRQKKITTKRYHQINAYSRNINVSINQMKLENEEMKNLSHEPKEFISKMTKNLELHDNSALEFENLELRKQIQQKTHIPEKCRVNSMPNHKNIIYSKKSEIAKTQIIPNRTSRSPLKHVRPISAKMLQTNFNEEQNVKLITNIGQNEKMVSKTDENITNAAMNIDCNTQLSKPPIFLRTCKTYSVFKPFQKDKSIPLNDNVSLGSDFSNNGKQLQSITVYRNAKQCKQINVGWNSSVISTNSKSISKIPVRQHQ